MALPSREQFEQLNRSLLEGRAVAEERLALWRRGRDWLVARALVDAALARPRDGRAERKHPRARIALQAHLAGHGRAFTEDLGFGGLMLRPQARLELQRGAEASVRLQLAGRSVYLDGEVAWADASRIGIRIRTIHPDDERLLQALVCARIVDRWDEDPVARAAS